MAKSVPIQKQRHYGMFLTNIYDIMTLLVLKAVHKKHFLTYL